MGKKKFIQKNEGQKFYLLHRSQTDAAYANEENPSNYVLVPADKDYNSSNHSHINNEFNESIDVKTLFKKGDHINELGFKNDGYDYSKHFKEMGGGKFIGVDGKIQQLPTNYSVNLPDDVMPSNEELERNLDAIVISEKYMDEDIRNALFMDEDEDGVFEELDDDFILQASAEPEAPDFDFDAHIARLIAASERDLEKVPARKWDDTTGKMVMKSIDEEEEEYEEDEFDDEGNSVVSSLNEEERLALDSQFEKTLEEYDDRQLGYIEESDDEEVGGYIDFEDENEYLDEVMEEFLIDQIEQGKYNRKDEILSKKFEALKLQKDKLPDNETIETSLKEEFQEQLLKQAEAEDIIQEVDELVAKQTDDDVWNSQVYLNKKPVADSWDCETILSSYSVLDNHPSLIRDSNSKFKSHKSKYAIAEESAEEQRKLKLESHDKLLNGSSNTNNSLNIPSTQRIVLSKKNMLPIGYGGIESKQKTKLVVINEDNSDESEDDEISVQDKKYISRSKLETAEEKKARKALVKEQKKLKRVMKKELKNTYKIEELKQLTSHARQQDINNAHVFKTV